MTEFSYDQIWGDEIEQVVQNDSLVSGLQNRNNNSVNH